MQFDHALVERLEKELPQTKNRRKRKILYKIIAAAKVGHYNPLTSKIPHAKTRLVEDLKLAGLRVFSQEVKDGRFRPEADDAQEFWKTPETTIPDGDSGDVGIEGHLEETWHVP